jgi:hypothetical protein
MKDATDVGKRRFGDFLQQCLERNGYISLSAAASAIAAKSGIPIVGSDLAVLIHAQWQDNFDFNHIYALLLSDTLRFPSDGRSLDFNDIIRTFKGEIDPLTY